MACDGEIAESEIKLVKDVTLQSNSLAGIDVELILNGYIEAINQDGQSFISQYLKEVKEIELTDDEAVNLIDLAIKTIEADENIEYSEVSFFKKIRSLLKVSDEKILSVLPDKEDYLLPDIIEPDFSIWNNKFSNINFQFSI
jgi:uncharacterized tellurite resistance protein B-like protein